MIATATQRQGLFTAESVAQRLAVCLPDIRFDRAARPTALPIDSLDLVAFLCAVDQEFGVRISTDEFQTAASVDALFEIIADRSNTNKATTTGD